MDRRGFCSKAGCAAAGMIAFPAAPDEPEAMVQEGRRYSWAIEIVEGPSDGCGWGHKPGDRWTYPDDKGQICVWLMDSMNGFLRVLEYGGTLDWTYEGTAYEKEIDPDGVTTEFVRCPDPTASGVVAKIIRTRVG